MEKTEYGHPYAFRDFSHYDRQHTDCISGSTKGEGDAVMQPKEIEIKKYRYCRHDNSKRFM